MPKRTRSIAETTENATPRKRRSTDRGRLSDGDEIALSTPVGQTTSNPAGLEADQKDSSIKRAGKNDRSARKKSTVVLRQHDTPVLHQDAEVDPNELDLARSILEDNYSQACSDDQADAGAEDEPEASTVQPSDTAVPVKRGRGRPKGRRKQRTPTPPPDLPGHELYFFHNRTTASQTSTNTLPSHALLNHDDYRAQIQAYEDTHKDDIERLAKLHYRSFEQWQFELDEGFSLCLYGFGSKRSLMLDFIDNVYQTSMSKRTIVIANGYDSSVTIKGILSSIAEVLFDEDTALPGQPSALLDAIIKQASKADEAILLVVHNLDSANLRKAPVQAMIAKLANVPHISLLASCDSLNFGLMWDLALLRQYNFVFHDATTFEPWTVEIDAVEEMNALLGRSSRRLAGKDGVGYVLRSLPENARNLFRILVAEQLALGDIDFTQVNGNQGDEDADLLGLSDEELAATQQNTPSKRGRGRPKKTPVKTSAALVEGVEYRMLYHKAVEEFVCSSEVNFRTLLKEFHDHQMIESRKDSMGTERLIVPFRREELEAILEEL